MAQITVQFEGLRKVKPAEDEDPSTLFTTNLTLPEDAPLKDVCKALHEQGYQQPQLISSGKINFHVEETKRRLPAHETFKLVSGEPAGEFEINVNETFIAFANRRYGKPIEFDIADIRSGDPKRPKRMIKDGRALSMSFQRTPRMPDDNKLHQLPGSLGSYDLFNVEAYADRLPANIRDAGGVFLPMWQREAMWINFEMSKSLSTPKYAVRVFVGKINAVSGLQMDEDPSKEGAHLGQDYIVLPDQKWLDGICVAPGIVRQFVAMPLGSGYTVEGQKTSEEKYGGLQIEVIPQYQTRLRLWIPDQDLASKKNDSVTDDLLLTIVINEQKTPADWGLLPGAFVRSYPAGEPERVPCTIIDLVAEGGDDVCRVSYPIVRRSPQQLPTVRERCSSRSMNVLTSVTRKSSSTAMWDVTEKKGLEGGVENYRRGPTRHVQEFSREVAPPPRPARTAGQFFEARSSYASNDAAPVELGADPLYAKLMPSRTSTSDSRKDQFSRSSTSKRTAVEVYSDTTAAEAQEEELDIDVETTDLKAMGLAAGGKLVQDIYKDRYPSNTWNHAAARIINVHILDPVSCEKVTHIVPLPPPMDAKTYAEQGGNFFVVEEQIDDRIEGGDFAAVKSVSAMDKHIGVSTEQEFDPSKPSMCAKCEMRLTDCIVRPCNHQFCNMCIKALEAAPQCPDCGSAFSHVAGFSAPMNLPGEEPMRLKVPVNVLEISDGRVKFKSVQKTRI